MSVTFLELHPVLPVRDVSQAVRYYVERLGFRLQFQDAVDDPKYAGVRRDQIELHLQWHDDASFQFVERLSLRLVISDVPALFAEYTPQGVFHDKTAVRETLWGTLEFAFYDLDGNGLTFYQDS